MAAATSRRSPSRQRTSQAEGAEADARGTRCPSASSVASTVASLREASYGSQPGAGALPPPPVFSIDALLAAEVQLCRTLLESPKAKKHVALLPSVFEGRPPTFLFPYTTVCGAKQRPMDRAIRVRSRGGKLLYCNGEKVHQYNAVRNVLRFGGINLGTPEAGDWLLMWSKQLSPEVACSLQVGQRLNHFVGSAHLGRKDLLWQHILKMQRVFSDEYEITPASFILPRTFVPWEMMRRHMPHMLWIWKPCSQSCGRGIRVLQSELTEDDEQLLRHKRGIVQQYIHNPLLINGFKFDLRVYVVVTSFDPLKVFLNDEGLVRLATEQYSTAEDTLDKRTMHLTNYSVNKESPAFVQNRDSRDSQGAEHEDGNDGGGQASKWSFAELRQYFDNRALDYDGMFERIKDLVLKTLIAVEPALRKEWAKALGRDESEGWAARGPNGAGRTSCFEIYGFDVLIDTDLKPWLLEVNIWPSLSSGSPLDKRIKTKLVADAFTLVGFRPPAGWLREAFGRSDSENAQRLCNEELVAAGCTLPAASLRHRAEVLKTLELKMRPGQCSAGSDQTNALERTKALDFFDDVAWELVISAAEEEMRGGGLQCIFPTAETSQYRRYFGEESYCNLVLRKWHEAGGHALLRSADRSRFLPAWLPKQIAFSRT